MAQRWLKRWLKQHLPKQAGREQLPSNPEPSETTDAAGDHGDLSSGEERSSANSVKAAAAKAVAGDKNIGLIGGVMLLINNLAGPTIVSMPALAQEAGWLALIAVELLVAAVAAGCGFMLLGAMRRMPGNRRFEKQVQYANLSDYYFPRPIGWLFMICYHSNMVLSLMSLIIQSAQVIDYLIMNWHGCAPGIAFLPRFELACGSAKDSSTPFGDRTVLSSSMFIVGLISVPFAVQNLDDNVVLQYLAILGLVVMACVWVAVLTHQPDFPTSLPAVTPALGGLVGTILFNFAFASSLPSWVSEKKPGVSVSKSFGFSLGFVVALYTLIGIVGGLAFKPFYSTDENLFSKLNASGSMLGRATVTAYPALQNFTSIPVLSILIRYNLIQAGLWRCTATMLALALPWVLSVFFYAGHGFDDIAEYGGLLTSSVVNFLGPLALYLIALQRGYAPEPSRVGFESETVEEGNPVSFSSSASSSEEEIS